MPKACFVCSSFFSAEIFNSTSYDVLHRAHIKWCEELSVSSDETCDA